MKILLEKTDEEHTITVPEMIAELGKLGISAERKSVYDDLEYLKLFGLDVCSRKTRTHDYFIGSREFELPELKLLVDSVQASKFMTAKKSIQLIKKIEGLASKYEAAQLQRQVYTTERIKAGNEGIYYNVDQIHTAIASNQQIRFHYFNWDVNKKQVLRKDGAYYQASPWALSWDDENYYLVAYDSAEEKIKHFRVDKMLHISTVEEKREGSKKFQAFDMGAYAKKMFGMFGGDEEMVKIVCKNELAGVMIDRFGQSISLVKVDAEHFSINVKVAVSSQFLSWVMALGDGAKIVSPERVVDKVREEIERLVKQYKK